MTWAKVDDRLHDHPKVIDAGVEAMGLWVLALTHTMGQMTDGFVSTRVVERLAGRRGHKLAAKLVDVRLWEVADGGWIFHDFAAYQLTKAAVEAERAKKSAAGRKSAELRGAPPTGVGTDAQREPNSRARVPSPIRSDADPIPRRSRRSRGVEINRPEGWKPSDKHEAFAATFGFASKDVDRMAERFTSWADSNGRRYIDWDAGFRTWIGNQADREGREKREVAPPRKAPPVSPPRASVQANIDKLVAGEKLPQQTLGWEGEPE
jgi:hypothetical protein